jgi:hypothetical protein
MLRIGLECIITKALFVMTVSIQIDTRVLSLDAVASVKKCRSRIFHKSKPACASRFEDDQTSQLDLQAAMVGTLAVGALRSMADAGIGPARRC